MVTNIDAVSAILKKDIYPALVDAIKQKTMLYQLVKDRFKPQKFVNNRFFMPVQLGLSSGFTSFGANASPSLNAGRVVPVEASWDVAQMTQRFIIDKITLDAGKGAVIDTLEMQAKAAKDTIIRQLNFGLWRNGGDQFFAVGAGSSSTNLVIGSGRTVDNGDINFAVYIPVNSRILIGGLVTTVIGSPARNTLTLSAARTWTNGDPVRVLDGDGNPLTYITGLLAAVGTGTYAGINPATHTQWRSWVSTPGAATPLVLPDMDQAHVEANQFGNVQYTFVNKTLYRRVASILRANPQVRVEQTPTLNGGWKSIKYMDHEFVLDYDVPDDCVFHISPDSLRLGELAPLDSVAGNEGTLFKAYGKVEWESTLYGSMQLVCENRAANALLERRTP